MRLPLLALGALLLAIPLASAQDAGELGILDAYLAGHDVGPPTASWPHCERHGGPDVFTEQPDVPLPPPTTHTNELLRHHALWHKERLSIAEGQTVSPDDANKYGDDFYSYHRAMILDYDAWREANGHEPVAPWDPSTPIPAEFAYEAPGCIPRRSADPRIERPSWATLEGGETTDPIFEEYRALCEFPDLNRLGKAIDPAASGGYHSSVHDGVSGDMAFPPTAPRDPAFWAWHKFLDESVFRLWERECGAAAPAPGVAGETEGATVERERATPAPPAWLALAGASVVAATLRTRRA